MRFAVCELNGPRANAFDSPNCGDVRIPIGVARFTLLNAFLTFTAKVRAYLLFVAPASIPRPPRPPRARLALARRDLVQMYRRPFPRSVPRLPRFRAPGQIRRSC